MWNRKILSLRRDRRSNEIVQNYKWKICRNKFYWEYSNLKWENCKSWLKRFVLNLNLNIHNVWLSGINWKLVSEIRSCVTERSIIKHLTWKIDWEDKNITGSETTSISVEYSGEKPDTPLWSKLRNLRTNMKTEIHKNFTRQVTSAPHFSFSWHEFWSKSFLAHETSFSWFCFTLHVDFLLAKPPRLTRYLIDALILFNFICLTSSCRCPRS